MTGLARSGKTALLTSLAANLMAAGAGLPALPMLTQRLAGRTLRVSLAPSGAEAMPRFDYNAHLAALDRDPPSWPARTQAVSLLALDVEIGRGGLAAALPPQSIRLELLDYPGEWLLDLPMLGMSFAEWSAQVLRRLEHGRAAALSEGFRGFVGGLPSQAPADDTIARTGHVLFRTLLERLRDEASLALLQPGRFLMPAPGQAPPWLEFFPFAGGGPLGDLLGRRYDAYRDSIRRDLVSPSFGRVDRLVILADVLSALHAGEEAFSDMRQALATAGSALKWRQPGFLPEWLGGLSRLLGGVHRVAFAASKSDHVADRQRGNLAALVARLVETPSTSGITTSSFALASVRCTEDIVWTLDRRPVSAVRGRIEGDERPVRSYPGEVPDRPPDGSFWEHPFLALPNFEPMRLPLAGRGGVPHINLDSLLAFLLEDILP